MRPLLPPISCAQAVRERKRSVTAMVAIHTTNPTEVRDDDGEVAMRTPHAPLRTASSSTVPMAAPVSSDVVQGCSVVERETGFEPATSCLGSKHSAR